MPIVLISFTYLLHYLPVFPGLICFRAIPTRPLWQVRRYNQPATADYSTVIAPVTLWEWPIYWATGQLIAGWSPSPGDRKVADLYKHV